MKKLIKRWQKIPRPYKVLLDLTLTLILAIAFYVSIGSPALSQMHAFRRAERANFVGPSTILFSGKAENSEATHLILGETEGGVIMYGVRDKYPSRFNYFEKTGDITVVSAPKLSLWYWGREYIAVSLPVFVVDEYPEAVRAELEVHVEGLVEHRINGEDFSITLDQYFSDEATREGDGYFYFSFDLPFIMPLDEYGNDIPDANHGADGYALDALAYAFMDYGTFAAGTTSSAIVRLYDADGTLIAESEQVLYPRM